jgi:uncharacterized protein
MEQRLIEFIAALRAAGVRVSIAESEDAWRAVQRLGILDRSDFSEALRATLIKKRGDEPVFEALFPCYFGVESSNLVNLLERLSPADRQRVQEVLQILREQLAHRGQDASPAQNGQIEAFSQSLEGLLQGQGPPASLLEQAENEARQHLPPGASAHRLQQLVLSRLGSQVLTKVQQPLRELLRQSGLPSGTVKALMEGLQANFEALSEQVARQSEKSLAQRWAEEQGERLHQAERLLHRPLDQLSEREAQLLRQEIRRLVAHLRSQVALRRKRARRGALNVRQTLRASWRYGGAPLELKFKRRSQKPRLLLLCDISNSMRHVVEFALRLVYELQDQVSSVRTFTYIDTLEEISQLFAQSPPETAIVKAAARLRPKHPNTDLGHCLELLLHRYPDTLDRRTTVLIVGDACNSWNDPRLDLMARVQKLSKAIIWLTPRERRMWDKNDCDMLKYLPYAQAVHPVSTMAELTAAVDKLLTR